MYKFTKQYLYNIAVAGHAQAFVHPRASFITCIWGVWPWNTALWPTPITHYAFLWCGIVLLISCMHQLYINIKTSWNQNFQFLRNTANSASQCVHYVIAIVLHCINIKKSWSQNFQCFRNIAYSVLICLHYVNYYFLHHSSYTRHVLNNFFTQSALISTLPQSYFMSFE